MQNEKQKAGTDRHDTPDMHDVMRDVSAAIRAVKLYPPNNPIYSQTVSRSYEKIERYLSDREGFHIGVRKTALFCNDVLLNTDAPLYKALVGDLYSRDIREIAFTRGVTLAELRDFYSMIALSREDLKQQGGIEFLLFDQGISHIHVREAALDDVTQTGSEEQQAPGNRTEPHGKEKNLGRSLRGREIVIGGRRVALEELVSDPGEFGNLALEMARRTGGTPEEEETRLFEVYREAGRQVLGEPSEQREVVFLALAHSLLSKEFGSREGPFTQQLYDEYDKIRLREQRTDFSDTDLPDLHEVLSARFSRPWSETHIAALLETVSSSEIGLSDMAGFSGDLRLPASLPGTARELSSYSPEEMEALKELSEAGTEGDIFNASIATMVRLLLAQDPLPATSQEHALNLFTKIVDLLEVALDSLLFDRNDFRTAAVVIRAFRSPAGPVFRPRLAQAIKQAGSKKRITAMIRALSAAARGSDEYGAIYSCLSSLDREATPVLLEMLAQEEDRAIGRLLIQVLKDLGKNQLALLGERLSDERWFFVRNIVSILGESRKEEAVDYLEKIAGHRNFQIRQEVVRALITIGGREAADLLTRFLKDEDIDIRFMAVRGLGTLSVADEKIERAVIDFLKKRRLKKTEQELKHEAVGSLGAVGGRAAAEFLKRFSRVKWWKARKPQEETRAAALKAIGEIERRLSHAP